MVKKLIIELPNMTHTYDLPGNEQLAIKFFLEEQDGKVRTDLGRLLLIIPDENDQVWLLRGSRFLREPTD